ncbi:hypothetical protein P7C73_g2732, partial [Tremellales sp. Uapishka_1]
MFTQTLLASCFFASSALAHFTLDFPTSRGFDEDTESQFCGGFNTINTRQPFPLGQSPVQIDSHHTLATVVAFVSTSTNPTSFNDFNTTSNGTAIPFLTPFFQISEGEACFDVNMGALGLGLTNGSLVTLQIQFDGGDGNLFQCADLILLSDYSPPSNETCTVNAATATTISGAAATSIIASSSASASASTSASASVSASASATKSAGEKQVVAFGLGAVGLLVGAVGFTLL